MANDAELKVGIEAQDNASPDLKKIATEVANLGDRLGDIVKQASAANRALNSLEKRVSGVANGSKGAAKTTAAMADQSKATTVALNAEAEATKRVYEAMKLKADASGKLRNERGQYASKETIALAKAQIEAIRQQIEAEAQLAATQRSRQAAAPGAFRTGGGNAVAVPNHQQELESIKASADARKQVGAIVAHTTAAIRANVEANIAESRSAREAGEANRSYAADLLAVQRAAADQQAKRYATVPKASNNVVTSDMRDLVATANGVRRVGDSFGIIETNAKKASRSVEEMNQHLFTSRFAYYDIAAATAIAGTALLAMNAATINAAATYETAMASIQRTTGTSNAALETLRQDFIGLAQTIPGGFDNLAKIGELAGQLNIPEQNIASFTETVAKFVSSTDVSVQSATEAFGRLDTLLPEVQGNYNALGSSILNVGVNSVATESAIISTTTQIAAAGAAAGMTADEVIGLAASFASLGIAPEAARGTVVRVLGDIGAAVSAGGTDLEKFGAVARMTGEEFATTFNSSGTEALMAFLNGLAAEGDNARASLTELGITGVRDINALLRLSQNMDIVSQSFGYAAEGFDNADALARAFGITSETLSAKLEVMAQSFQAFLAEMGDGQLGPLKAFVDMINGLLKVVTDAAGTPFFQWTAALVALVSVVSGGVLLITAFTARMAAFRASVLLTKIQLDAMAVSATGANSRLITMRTSALNAAMGLATLRGALMAIGKSTVILGAVMLAVTESMRIFETTFKDARDIASDAGVDFALLRRALDEDTAAADRGEEGFRTLTGTLRTMTTTQASWVSQIESATGAQVASTSATQRQIEETEKLTLTLGANSKAVLANQLANSQSFQSFVKNMAEYTKSGQYEGLDLSGLVTRLAEGDIDGARKLYNDWATEQRRILAFSGDLAARNNLENTINDAGKAIKEIEGTIGGAKDMTELLGIVSEATGVPIQNLAGTLDEAGESANSAADDYSKLTSAISTAFGPLSTLVDWTAAAQQLFTGLTESGVSGFNAMGEAGATNLSNLTNAIATTIAAGATMGVDTTQSVAALFLTLQNMGIDTANLLAAVAKIPGVDAAQFNGYINGTVQMSDAGAYLASVMGTLASSAGSASTGVGGVGDAANEASDALEEAAVSAADFASTLGQILDRANDIRYGVQGAKDAVYTMLNTIKKEADEAYLNIEKLNMEIAALQGENSNLDYALQVAIDYGDTMRENEIRAEQARIAAEIAEKATQAAEEQAKLSKETEGTTQAAVDNRAALLELSEGYQDQIEAYAATGASQAEVEAYAKKLYAQYKKEATALGYSAEAVGKYGQGILDMGKIAAALPDDVVTNIAIKGLDPAIAALKEFEAQAQKSAQNASNSIRTGGGGGYGVPDIAPPNLGKLPTEKAREWGDNAKLRIERGMPPVGVPMTPAQARAQGWGKAFASGLSKYLDTKRIRTAPGTQVTFNPDGTLKEGSVGRFKFYKTGGYTGDGSKHNLAGMVHGKEYVVNEENTSRLGIPFLDALNSGKTPVAPVASSRGVQVVELSARDRALLAQAGNTTLTIDGKVVGQVANAANFGAGRRGSN